MAFIMEVLVEETTQDIDGIPRLVEVWKAIRPTGGVPYEYTEKAQAERMARLCYPGIEHAGKVRVMEV